MNCSPADRLFSKLIAGQSLDSSAGTLVDGRLDLRNSVAPSGDRHKRSSSVSTVDCVIIDNAQWRDLDLSQSRLRSFRLHGMRIENCKFVGADCRDWRLWGTRIFNTSFVEADLRTAALGAVEVGGRRNVFENVDFTRADLRGSNYLSAEFRGCLFDHARLNGVDFQGSAFVDCVFVGPLSDVMFYRSGFRGETLPPNEMTRVDFSRADLRYVEFRGLDMTTIVWPASDSHIVLRNYARTLDALVSHLSDRKDSASKSLLAIVEMLRKWRGSNQVVGVIHKEDISSCGDEGLVDVVARIAEAMRH